VFFGQFIFAFLPINNSIGVAYANSVGKAVHHFAEFVASQHLWVNMR
tara:strand:+ start:663 stop:803 length:141 start_codon:yes stop_codon:yes gene_type:complete